MAHPFWPLFDLQIDTPILTLRYLDDELGRELGELMIDPIHDPAEMPFANACTDAAVPQRHRRALQFWWRCRAAVAPASWDLNFAIVVGARAVGACGMHADDFVTLRSFGTGSWIGMAHQGQGYGNEMRAAMLHLGFAGFDAVEATTGAFVDNVRSIGVTRHLGYEPNGTERKLQRDAAGDVAKFRMSRDHWRSIRRDDITIAGLDDAREMLGLAS